MSPAPLRVGLTGGIGSGKSTVGAMLADCGAALIDADAISRALTAAGGAAIAAIRSHFGPAFVDADGSLQRERMRELVFREPQRKKELEAIIHPLVGQQIQAQSAVAQNGGARCLVFDIPLLVESAHWRARVQRVLVVDCDAATQVRRVMARSAMAEAEVRAIIAAQASREQRLRAADDVVCNQDLSLEQLREQVSQLARRFGL